MESINQQVWQAMRSDPAIMQDMQRGLINMRALAKFLIDKYELRASLDAVISSIRRFPMPAAAEEERVLRAIFKDSVVGTTNNIACVTIAHPPSEVIPKLAGLALQNIRLVTGIDEVKVLVKNSAADRVSKSFKNTEVVPNLSEISVIVAEKAVKTKGVMARMASEIALAGINVHELLVCPPQFLIYVAEKDIVKAHERVLSLTE
ncbi:hypothetical protein C4580_02530 [Candidatus Woesearchaeota archaeon]|nr:MAG: hypothetical protein C4580_02530 [Candidatus Woesearchaeota archaeon]